MENGIAETIYNQLGRQAFVMMGAKNIVAGENNLLFQVGKNSEKIHKIDITLAPDDTYIVTAYNRKYQTVAKMEDVYCDALKPVIQVMTGLYLSL